MLFDIVCINVFSKFVVSGVLNNIGYFCVVSWCVFRCVNVCFVVYLLIVLGVVRLFGECFDEY